MSFAVYEGTQWMGLQCPLQTSPVSLSPEVRQRPPNGVRPRYTRHLGSPCASSGSSTQGGGLNSSSPLRTSTTHTPLVSFRGLPFNLLNPLRSAPRVAAAKFRPCVEIPVTQLYALLVVSVVGPLSVDKAAKTRPQNCKGVCGVRVAPVP